MKKNTKDTIQWHPAFQASIQIEFEAEAEKLTFEPEHLLSKKPMQMDELTITFICNHFPRKMVQHLKEFRGLDILHVEAGIYYITGDAFPIQLLVTKRVTEQVTEEFIRTLSKSITDVNKLAELLNLPVEQINKVLNK